MRNFIIVGFVSLVLSYAVLAGETPATPAAPTTTPATETCDPADALASVLKGCQIYGLARGEEESCEETSFEPTREQLWNGTALGRMLLRHRPGQR